MPYISTEALVGAALLIVLAVGYQYLPQSAASVSAKAAKKNKRRRNKGQANGGGGSEDNIRGEDVVQEGGKKAKRKGASQATRPSTSSSTTTHTPQTQSSSQTSQSAQPPSSTTSFASVASSATSTPTPAPKGKPKTLAQRIAPQPRKTKVDDMLAPEDRPATHARVMKIAEQAAPGSSRSAPAPGPSLAPPIPASDRHHETDTPSNGNASDSSKIAKYEADYVDESDDDEDTSGGGTVEGEDDGWDVVVSKKKPLSLPLSTSNPGQATKPVSTSDATKVQRKNAKKAEAKKAARAAEEEDRQRRLKLHKRELEREKINEIYTTGQKKSKAVAGAKATMDHNGKLIWD